MIGFLFRRIGFTALAGWIAITLNFFLPRLMPGDPAAVLFARFQGKASPEALDAMRQTFGLTDESLMRQYWQYLVSLFHGELGTSLAYFPAPVSGLMAEGLLWTSFLAGGSLIISFALGTTLGGWIAWRREGFWDTLLPPFFALVSAFPYFWVAMLTLSVLGFEAGWFPVRHAYASTLEPSWSWDFAHSVVSHAFLPALTMVICSLGGWMLSMRNTMVGTLGGEAVQYAHCRGIPSARVAWTVAARNAIIPNFTGFGMALGFVISGAMLTEVVFSYPGQGYLLLNAVTAQDYPLMQGIFLSITAAVLIANLLVDVSMWWVDPRTREER